jgi:hypothetical protein
VEGSRLRHDGIVGLSPVEPHPFAARQFDGHDARGGIAPEEQLVKVLG